ncbi:MAG: oxidoreductase, short chain dehydrogenase /reductase family [Promethearchaeota archaeon CR_4]|nr:MAG: oxidoreductase, short chain dehydrogenase /reductase family [Candidatus Lokiarchaeota archaeon CR_4]
MITGSTDGIGRQAALELAQMQMDVIVHGRNLKKTQEAALGIKKQAGNNNIDFIAGDFSSLSDVKRMAADFHQKYAKLDVLLNNVGVWEKERLVTQDGFEMTFQVNYLAHFLLTLSLLDLIKNAAPSRIVGVSSTAQANALDFNNLQGEQSFNGYIQYGASKLCDLLFTIELANQLRTSNITANCLHPGVIATKLLRNGVGPNIGDPVTNGAKMHVYLATSPEMESVTGEFIVDKHPFRVGDVCQDEMVRKKLWQLSEKMVGIKFAAVPKKAAKKIAKKAAKKSK